MSVLEAIIMGILQGLTEFLPVSSSGHGTSGGSAFGADHAFIFSGVAEMR